MGTPRGGPEVEQDVGTPSGSPDPAALTDTRHRVRKQHLTKQLAQKSQMATIEHIGVRDKHRVQTSVNARRGRHRSALPAKGIALMLCGERSNAGSIRQQGYAHQKAPSTTSVAKGAQSPKQRDYIENTQYNEICATKSDCKPSETANASARAGGGRGRAFGLAPGSHTLGSFHALQRYIHL